MIRTDPHPVAMIPFVNMTPFQQLGAPPGCRFVPLVPRKSVAALQNGSVVAAAVPVGGLFALEERVEFLGKFGIAGKQESMSVMLFSDRPFEALDGSCAIRMTSASATSVRLCYLLMRMVLGSERIPRLAAGSEPINAELLIGDRAITRAARLLGWADRELASPSDPLPVVTDLAALWRQTVGLPFVFARWVVRRDADAAVKSVLNQWLETFRENEAAMVEACIMPAARRLEITPAAVRRYFRVIHRCLDDEDLSGQKRFMAEFDKIKNESFLSRLFGEQGV